MRDYQIELTPGWARRSAKNLAHKTLVEDSSCYSCGPFRLPLINYAKWMMRAPLPAGSIFSHTWTLGESVQELFDRIPKEGHFELTVLPHGATVEVIP